MELLLLRDHALSLRDKLHSAGLGPSSFPEETSTVADVAKIGPGEVSTATSSPAVAAAAAMVASSSLRSHSSPDLLLQLAALPRLSRLVRARGEGYRDHQLPHARSEAAILEEYADSRRKLTRTRPRSAGVARPLASSGLTLVASPGVSSTGGPGAARRLDKGAKKDLRRSGGAVRPTSAPGRRPRGGGAAEPVLEGQGGEGGIARGGGGLEGRGFRALVGWKNQDIVGRDAGELSRDGLLYLVNQLRERLGANSSKRRDEEQGGEVRDTC